MSKSPDLRGFVRGHEIGLAYEPQDGQLARLGRVRVQERVVAGGVLHQPG